MTCDWCGLHESYATILPLYDGAKFLGHACSDCAGVVLHDDDPDEPPHHKFAADVPTPGKDGRE